MIKLNSLSLLLCFLFVALLFSCNQKTDPEQEREKVLALIASMREAHFESDSEKFLAPMLDSFVEIRAGRYVRLYKNESLPGIQSYFDSMEFLELEDVQEPVLEISEDATMASYIGSIILKGRMDNEPVFSKLSFQSLLRKEGGQWKIIHNANSFLPKAGLGPVIMDRVKSQFADVSDSMFISAKANCSGPTDDFITLVMSASAEGRMEQRSTDGHIILQHGDSGSWMRDAQGEEVRENLNSLLVGFIVGHEYHWLSYRPEDRLENPEFKRITQFEQKTAFEIAFEDSMSREILFYYSFDDYKPLGFDYPSQREEEMIRSQFLDWTVLDGIPVFQKVIIEENQNLWEYQFTELNIVKRTGSEFDSMEPLL